MKNKKERLIAIREIISNASIGSQEELLAILIKRGFDLTQATLSRDLKQLHIVKIANNEGGYMYILSEKGSVAKFIQPRLNGEVPLSTSGFISIEFSYNVAVIRTRPGYASSIAYDIDANSPQEILGTIAGDDTILIIPREGFTREEIVEALAVFIPNIQK